jgi:hypothetical protein
VGCVDRGAFLLALITNVLLCLCAYILPDAGSGPEIPVKDHRCGCMSAICAREVYAETFRGLQPPFSSESEMMRPSLPTFRVSSCASDALACAVTLS